MWSNVYVRAVVALATIVPKLTAWSSASASSVVGRPRTAASAATVNDAADHGGDSQHVTRGVVERLEAHRDGVLDVGRQRQRHPSRRIGRSAVEVVQPLLGDEEMRDRVDEQRVALGRPVDGLDDCAPRRLADDLLDELGDLRLGEAAQREHAPVAMHAREQCPGPGLGGILGSVRGDDPDPAVGQVASDELQQPQRVEVGGVDVVEDEQQRPHHRRLTEDRGDVVEQREPAGDDRLVVGIGIAVECGQLRNDGGHAGEQRFLGVAARPAEPVVHEASEHLGPRPERRRAAVLPAASPQHRESGVARRARSGP